MLLVTRSRDYAQSNFRQMRGQVGQRTRLFLHGVAAVGLYFLAARALTMATQILAGRWLGPSAFGTATLILAVANLVAIPIHMGFYMSAVKFPAMEGTPERQSAAFSTVVWLNAAWALPAALFLWLIRPLLLSTLSIPGWIFAWSLAHAGIHSLRLLLVSGLRGLKLFARRGQTELAYGACSLLLFMTLNGMAGSPFWTYTGALVGGLVVSTGVALYSLRGRIGLRFDFETARSVRGYFLPPAIDAAAGALIASTTPIVLAGTLSMEEVGLFSAYRLGTLMIAEALGVIFDTVLAPLASTWASQTAAWSKLLRLGGLLFAALCGAFALTGAITLLLLGDGYAIRLSLLATFAATAAIGVIRTLTLSLLFVRSAQGFWVGIGGNALLGVLCLVSAPWAIPRYGLPAAAMALLMSYSLSLAWCLAIGSRHLPGPSRAGQGPRPGDSSPGRHGSRACGAAAP